jgi:hypothetical protein
MKTPYRENVRGEQMNRKLDYLFYVNPLSRLAFVIGILNPPALIYLSLARAAERGGHLPVHPAIVILVYVLGAILAAIVVIQNVYHPDKQPRRFFLMLSWWPLACAWFLVSWILFGRVLKGKP